MQIKDYMQLKRGNETKGIHMDVYSNGNASAVIGKEYLSLEELKVITERLETLVSGFKDIENKIKA